LNISRLWVAVVVECAIAAFVNAAKLEMIGASLTRSGPENAALVGKEKQCNVNV
jgi:hypothetical protein